MAQNTIHGDVQKAAKAITGATVSSTSITFSGNLDHHQLAELIHKCEASKCDLKLVSGTLTLVPQATQ